MINKAGKKTKAWDKARAKLKLEYQEKGITYCEICSGTFALSFHHRHKRGWYNTRPYLLGEFNQTLLLCGDHHAELEYDKKLTAHWFKKLRIQDSSDLTNSFQ